MSLRQLEDLMTILEARPYAAADLDANAILLVRELLELERQERDLSQQRHELHLRIERVFTQLEDLGWGRPKRLRLA